MQHRPAISVIIPVYRAEQYLRRCVDSLLRQTFTDFELLLIDDGSPDCSGAICDEYAAAEERVRVFHRPNGGVGAARQCGLEHARGTYIIHTDPDDWVDPAMLGELYACAVEHDAGVVLADYIDEGKSGPQRIVQRPRSTAPDHLIGELLAGTLHGSLCNKLIRRTCYENCGLRFPQISVWEDLYAVCEILRRHPKTVYLPRAFYHYDRCSNPGSATRNIRRRNIEAQELVIRHFEAQPDMKPFAPQLLALKCATKELCWRRKLIEGKEFEALFAEINSRYLDRGVRRFTVPRYIGMTLRGHESLARLLFRIVH